MILSVWIVFFLFGITHCNAKAKQRPRNVTATISDVTGIRLYWLAPRQQQECPVKRYLIRLKHNGHKRSKTWKVDGNRHSLGLHDLQEDTWYSLRLVAVTCEGKGAPTRWIKVRTGRYRDDKPPESADDADADKTEEAAPGKPTYVRTRTYSDSVMVTWRPPEDHAVLVRGYMVGYGEGVPDVNWRYVDAASSNVTIHNLKPETQYVISLRAFNNYGKGPVIYDLIFTREKNSPTVGPFPAPTNLKAKILSPSNAWLQWSDPSLGRPQQITDNRYYNVHYQPLPSGKTLSLIVKDLHVVLYELTPGTNYLFKVRTVKNSQSSSFSLATQNRTFETVPTSPPRSVKVSPGNESSTALISWKPPRQPNGELSAYMVMYTMQPNVSITKWQVRMIMGMSTHALLTNLISNTTYYLKVQAQNRQGYGPASPAVSFKTPDERYRKWHNTMTSSTLSPSTEHDREDYLYDDDDDGGGGGGRGTERVVIAPTPEDVMIVRTPGRPDRNEVAASEAGGGVVEAAALVSSDPAEEHVGSGGKSERGERSLQVKFQSVVKHSVSAVITWQEPCEQEQQWARYQVRYHAIDTPDRPHEKYSPTNFVIVDNLRPNTRYLYKVKRLRSDGQESAWSDPGLLDTASPDND